MNDPTLDPAHVYNIVRAIKTEEGIRVTKRCYHCRLIEQLETFTDRCVIEYWTWTGEEPTMDTLSSVSRRVTWNEIEKK
jgi:hypothetical protein